MSVSIVDGRRKEDCQTAKQPSRYVQDCEIRDYATDHVAVCYLLHQRVIGQPTHVHDIASFLVATLGIPSEGMEHFLEASCPATK